MDEEWIAWKKKLIAVLLAYYKVEVDQWFYCTSGICGILSIAFLMLERDTSHKQPLLVEGATPAVGNPYLLFSLYLLFFMQYLTEKSAHSTHSLQRLLPFTHVAHQFFTSFQSSMMFHCMDIIYFYLCVH